MLDPPARGLSPPAAAATAPAATTPEPAQADRPEISVIITAYRRRQFLSEALHSVVRQSMEPGQVEVVLVKDFADPSTDAEIAASPVTVRTVTEDLPLGEALARAIEMSRGRLLCFLDDDDRFVPGKLTEVLRYFSQNPSAGFLRNSFRAIDAEGRPLSGFGKTRPQPPNSRTIGPGPGDPRALAWIYHYSAHINLSSMTVRAELARPALPWLRRLTGGSDIFWFFVALTASSDLGIESRPWTEYRIHASTSHASIDPAGQDRELADVRRNVATADLLAEMYPRRRQSELARRFLESYRLEARVTSFLMGERTGRWFPGWGAFGRTIFWRRQRYLLVPWAYCLLKAIAPSLATARYRSRRRRDMLRSADPRSPYPSKPGT